MEKIVVGFSILISLAGASICAYMGHKDLAHSWFNMPMVICLLFGIFGVYMGSSIPEE